MARARDPAYDKAKMLYIDSRGKMKLIDIAAEVGKSDSQIRKWKSSKKWDDELNGNVTNESEKVNGNVTKSNAAPKGNKYAKGNKGNKNPENQFPKRNTVAMKHGFYSRLIPDDMQELFTELDDGMDTSEMLWDQIKLQYIAIMRAQKIMFVTDKDEMIKEVVKAKYDLIPHPTDENEIMPVATEEEYQFQFAWERQAQFLTAQSRAISELRTSIKQFEEMADANDERLLKLKKMRLDIKKTKAELAALNKTGGATQTVVNINDPWRGDDFE